MTDKELLKRFSSNLQKWKYKRNMTIKKLADRCLMSRTEVSHLLYGKRLPHNTTLCCLCEVLDIDPVELFKPLDKDIING